MGLFSSVIHLKDTTQDQVVAGLDRCLADLGFDKIQDLPIPSSGPSEVWCQADVPYIVSPRNGAWVTVIQAYLDASQGPWIADLSSRLSKDLSTYTFSLMVHDSDVFCYNLDYKGEAKDGYNSNPQYFEQQLLSKAVVDQQRHSPSELAPILPDDVAVEAVEALLNKGWWNAYDHNLLDEHGVQQDDAGFALEDDRMIQLGELLELNGKGTPYRYAGWAEATDWKGFRALVYCKK